MVYNLTILELILYMLHINGLTSLTAILTKNFYTMKDTEMLEK